MTRDPIDELRGHDPAAAARVGDPPVEMAARIVNGSPGSARRGRNVVIAVATAAVVVVLGGGWLLWLRTAPEADVTGETVATIVPPTEGAPPTSEPAAITTEAAVITTEPVTTTPVTTAAPAGSTTSTTTEAPPEVVDAPVGPDLGDAPWTLEPLPIDAVPEVLVAEWTGAENRTWCAALMPTSLGYVEADVRSEMFSGGWAVAFDVPGAPGRTEDEEPCEDCGNGTFGVAGPGWAAAPDGIARWPNRVFWDDGSEAGYGFLGDAAPDEGVPLLAYLRAGGQGCQYNVWTYLGEAHLLTLLDSLRKVEGLDAEPVTPVTYRSPEPVDLAEPGWAGPPLSASRVPAVLVDAWESATWPAGACPILAFESFTGFGEEGTPTPRRMAGDSYGVAWDLPAGAGNHPVPWGGYCADCGRNAFGFLVTLSAGDDRTYDRFPVTHAWDDGSFAWIYSEGTVFSGGIPADRIEYFDSATGEPLPTEPYRAFLQVDGADCGYLVWSFLGEVHLMDLLGQMKVVVEAG